MLQAPVHRFDHEFLKATGGTTCARQMRIKPKISQGAKDAKLVGMYAVKTTCVARTILVVALGKSLQQRGLRHSP